MLLNIFLIYRTDRLSGLEKGAYVLKCFSVRPIPGNVRDATHMRLHDNSVVANEVRAIAKSAESVSIPIGHLLDFGFAMEHVQPGTANFA